VSKFKPSPDFNVDVKTLNVLSFAALVVRAEMSNDVKLQIELSKLLPLRVVDQHGSPIHASSSYYGNALIIEFPICFMMHDTITSPPFSNSPLPLFPWYFDKS
jgi:hypothetical protein